MNKFRVNLHPAFFNMDQESSRESFNGSVDKIKSDLDGLKNDILEKNNIEISTMIKGLGEGERNKYFDNITGRRLDQQRFLNRWNENQDGWKTKISSGLGYLITQLIEAGYFNGTEQYQRKEELNKVKNLYYEEVKNQFLNFVRYASKKRFNALKGTLFDYNTVGSPSDIIYKNLTNASSSVEKTEKTMAVEGYSTTILDTKSNDNSSREESDNPAKETKENDLDKVKENKKFLSRTLPAELWNLKVKFASKSKDVKLLDPSTWTLKNLTGWGSWEVINKIPLVNQILRFGNYSESQNDREAIADFVDVASKIKVEDSAPEMEMLKLFAEMKPTSGISEYEYALQVHGIDLNGVKLKDFMDVGKYYVKTQTKISNEQHPIYLSIMQVIRDNGSIDKAVSELKSIIEQAREEKKDHGKEYKKGKETVLREDVKKFAEKFGVTDFTNISRLDQLAQDNNTKYFDQPVEKILANLNNDDLIAASDWQKGGNKSGQQFLEIYSKLDNNGKEEALQNLLSRAKLESKIYGVGDEIKDIQDVTEEVKNKNVKLIFLLQNIIANPGGDLHLLLTQKNGRSIDFGQLESEVANRDAALKFVQKQLTEDEYNEIIKNIKKDEGAEITSFASLQSSMAAYLYDCYRFGLGISTTVSFDEWAKGLKFSFGEQVRRKDKGGVFGINITYDKNILQKKGWTLKGQLGAGINFPIASWKKQKPDGNVNIGAVLDKKISKKSGTAWHIGAEGGLTQSTKLSIYAGLHAYRDRIEDLEEAADIYKQNFEGVMNYILSKYGGKELDIEDKKLRENIRTQIEYNAKIKDKDAENVTNGIMRILISYNGADLTKVGMKEVIASHVAEQYKLTRIERQKEKKSKYYYPAGLALGGFLTAGGKWGAYADVRMLQGHYEDGRKDVATRVQETRDRQQEIGKTGEKDAGGRNIQRIATLNQSLRLPEDGGLSLEQGLIKIPESLVDKGMVNLGEDMRGKIYKDKDGNIYLSAWTPIHHEVEFGTGTIGRLLHVGNGQNEIQLNDRVDSGWYSADTKDLNKNMIIETNKKVYTVKNAKEAIRGMLASPKGQKYLKDFDLKQNEQKIDGLKQILSNLANSPHKVQIVIERNKGGFDVRAEDTSKLGSGFEIDYQVKLEMFNSNAESIAKQVYTQVSQIENAEILNSVKHEKGRYYSKFEDDYKAFVEAMGLYGNVGTKDYQIAKGKIQTIFTTLDNLYSGETDFSYIGNRLNSLSGEDLGQALLSINNIFARSSRVKGKDTNNAKLTEYDFTTNIGNIITEREGQISATIQKVLGANDPGYGKLIQAMKAHRIDNPDSFNKNSASAYAKLNTVGFNLGDKINPENPLFNPEIYDIAVSLDDLIGDGFTVDDVNNLHRHVMEQFATNDTLFYNIKAAFGVNGTVRVNSFSRRGSKGELTLDIGGKIITLSADMKVGYFTQCVNHTVILENIQAESDGFRMNYDSVTGGAEKVSEGTGGTNIGTWNFNLHLFGVFDKGDKGSQNGPVATDLDGDAYNMFGTDDGDSPDPKDPINEQGNNNSNTTGEH